MFIVSNASKTEVREFHDLFRAVSFYQLMVKQHNGESWSIVGGIE